MDLTADDLDKILSVIRSQNEREQELAGIPQTEEDKLVDKNVIKSREGSTFRRGIGRVISTLTGNERRRTYNVAFEMARAFFDFNKKKQKDEKPPTLIAESKSKVDAGTEMLSKEKDPKKLGKLGLLAAAIAAIVYLANLVWEEFSGLGTWAMKAILKAPNLIKAFHTGLKTFFKGYTKFVDDLAKWFDEGLEGAKAGAKGLTKIAGSLKGSIFKAAKFLGVRIAKYLKFIPLFGSLVSFVFAYKAFSEGRWFRGSLEFLSGVLNLPIFGPLGFVASAALDGAMLIYDLLEDKSGQAGAASVATKAVKYGLKFADVLFKVAGKVAKPLLTAMKFLPLIGGFAGFAIAYMRFKEGDWLAGSLEVVAAIADFVPGVGTAISWVLDGALLLYDLLKTPENKEEGVKGTIKSGGLWGVVKRAAASVGRWLVENIRWIPFFGNLWSIGEGIGSFMDGKWGEGTFQIIQGLMFFIPPALSDKLIDGLDWVMSLFTTKEDMRIKSAGGQVKPFSTKVKEFIDKKMADLPWWIRKPLEWLGILDSSDNGNWSMPQASMEWAYRIANAFNDLGDKVISSLRDFIPRVIDAFRDGVEYLKNAYMNWAHEQSRLTPEDVSEMNRKGESTAAIAQEAYMKSTGIEDRAELPSQMLRAQYQQLKAQKEFTGTLAEFRESVLGDTVKKYEQANKTLIQNLKGMDAMLREGRSKSDPMWLQMERQAKAANKTMEELQRAALEERISVNSLQVPKPSETMADTNDLLAQNNELRIRVNSPQVPKPSETMADTNDLLAQNNELMFQLLGVEKQALLETKKNKPGVVVAGGESKALGGNAVQGSFSSNRPGSKGSYNSSPYSLGASTPHVSM